MSIPNYFYPNLQYAGNSESRWASVVGTSQVGFA